MLFGRFGISKVLGNGPDLCKPGVLVVRRVVGVQEALRRLGVEAKEAVFVGDIVWADVEGPQALGMKAMLTRQYRQEDPDKVRPDLVVQRLSVPMVSMRPSVYSTRNCISNFGAERHGAL